MRLMSYKILLIQLWICFGVLVLNNAQYDYTDGIANTAACANEIEKGQFATLSPKFHETINDWSYDIFDLADATNDHPLMYLVPCLFNMYGLIDKFNIDPTSLMNFIDRIEEGYKRYNVSYHNDYHPADIARTLHSIIWNTGLTSWMTDLEIFASIFAAVIHDYEHMGLTNDFLVNVKSERALIYNDISVNENHHVSASFRIVRDNCCNILSNLTSTQYKDFRKLVINMVLSTDMARHSDIMDSVIYSFTKMKPDQQRSKAFELMLHVSDISNPAKNWSVAYTWVGLVFDEFFKQGDLELDLGLPQCSLCDRNINVAKSQIFFTDVIVKPSFEVMTYMIEYVLSENEEYTIKIETPWLRCIQENVGKWNEIANAGSEETE